MDFAHLGAACILLVVLLLAIGACAPEEDAGRLSELTDALEKLRPLHRRLGPPRPGDWLAEHRESGQTFRQYLRSGPVTPRGRRHTLYVQPLGEFTDAQRRVVELTAQFMGLYFSLPVTVNEDLPLSLIPDEARRVHPSWGDRQMLAPYVIDRVLKPRLPDDAAACIAFTAGDLWPGRGWNFVFGQASLTDRVGVWSICRNGDPAESPEAFRLCLLRTMKTGAHETGHMFGMLHCTAYECCMCGSNHREEADRRPLACCPECVAKVWWATGAEPVERYRKLAEFCTEHGLQPEAEFYERSLAALAGDAEPQAADPAAGD
jgi:archaemetzincin